MITREEALRRLGVIANEMVPLCHAWGGAYRTAVAQFYVNQAVKRGVERQKIQPGSVIFLQRFGGRLLKSSPSFSRRTVPRPRPRRTLASSASPLLICLSRPCLAAPRLAAYRCENAICISYPSLDSLRHMDGIVDIYMPDFKYWHPEQAKRYLKSPKYPEAARAAIQEMHRQVGDLTFDDRGLARRGLLVRHLVMPEALEETRHIMQFLATEISSRTYVNIMDQYYPAGKVSPEKYPELCRRTTSREVQAAFALACAAGLSRFDERWHTNKISAPWS